LAAEYVAAIDRLVIGQWMVAARRSAGEGAKPASAGYKEQHLYAITAFLQDCQEWAWIPRHLDPRRCFATPRAIRAQLTPNPRVIEDDIWAKLLWAGLNLSAEDLPGGLWIEQGKEQGAARRPWYPLETLRAIVVVWLFGGMRREEITRLRVGCVRWQQEDVTNSDSDARVLRAVPHDAVCFLSISTNKTGAAFVKPVDHLVGEAIALWESLRPIQPAMVDHKTGDVVPYLFCYRARRMGQDYLNDTVIPMLCRKAGVPEQDARGNITSHRAPSTIASQLFNTNEPLSLFELQEWLGHRSPASTQHDARITPTKLAKAYAEAGYFGRNVRMIEVLIDQDVVKAGTAAGEPWRYYDLGHGFCSYDFFDRCPHRMACAKCAFYVPKGSSRAEVLEGKANLLRLLQEMRLTEDERAAVEDGVATFERLLTKLADVPTPTGAAPRQLSGRGIIPLRSVSVPVEGKESGPGG
jgi:integrase